MGSGSEMKGSLDGALACETSWGLAVFSPPPGRPTQGMRVWGTLCRQHIPGAALSPDPSFLQAPALQLKLITN